MANLPSTELEAVNAMLEAIGEAPVSSLNDTGLSEVSRARKFLHNASRSLQMVGWHWNTDKDYTLTPNQAGELVLPANTLNIDTVQEDIGKDLVWRGTRLYDRVNHTYTFTKSVKVDIVYFLPFEELPEVARHYITVKATLNFAKSIGSETLVSFTMRDEMEAWSKLLDAEGETGDYNILTGNLDVYRVLRR